MSFSNVSLCSRCAGDEPRARPCRRAGRSARRCPRSSWWASWLWRCTCATISPSPTRGVRGSARSRRRERSTRIKCRWRKAINDASQLCFLMGRHQNSATNYRVRTFRKLPTKGLKIWVQFLEAFFKNWQWYSKKNLSPTHFPYFIIFTDFLNI